VESSKRPAFRLTPRDCEIIRAVNDCRALQTRHIETLFFTSPKPAYKRLQKLYHHEYLDRQFITQVTRAPAASPIVYTITKLGASVLATAYGYTEDQFRFSSRSVTQWETLQHILAIADVWAAIVRASSESNIAVVEWRDELIFRSNPDTVWVKSVSGRQTKKPVLPDGYFHLKTPKGETRLFLEVDRGIEGLQQIKDQIQVYQEYMVSGGYQERFQAKSLRILIVTTGKKRRDNIRKAIASVGGGERYWVTTFEQMTSTDIFTAPIWYRPADSEGISFLG
jgi:hypothetical protein